MMFIQNSSFHVLYTKDVETTAMFYKQIGCHIKKQEADKVVITVESFEFHFILNSTEPCEEYKYIADNGNYGQGIIFYVGTTSIEEVYKTIKNAGGKIKKELFTNHWNAKEFLFEDPNGYKFAVYQEI